ncbi:hypothetical protein LUW75_10695 [Streptomyces sp. MRC013]|uniref:hypothetical protein n=1 Tax=Streptomyces sp. MRC013 TaxID=2898276 RepID=UPI002026641C|nr:hypothetical protein [Streptomyces sp. MRC013]URM90382.1 hypothetical protein LUW75_10695 [Streptomyces sp. MRC013]
MTTVPTGGHPAQPKTGHVTATTPFGARVAADILGELPQLAQRVTATELAAVCTDAAIQAGILPTNGEHPAVTSIRTARATASGEYADFLDLLLTEFERTGDPEGVARQLARGLDRDRLLRLCVEARVRIVPADGPNARMLSVSILTDAGPDGVREFFVPQGQSDRDTLGLLRAALARQAAR